MHPVPLQQFDSKAVAACCASRGERLFVATAEADGALRHFDAASGIERGHVPTGHQGAITALATACIDGRPIALTGGEDGTVRSWDLLEGEALGKPLVPAVNGEPLGFPIRRLAIDLVGGHALARITAATSTTCDGEGAYEDGLATWLFDLTTGAFLGAPIASGYGLLPLGTRNGSLLALSVEADPHRVRVVDLRGPDATLGKPFHGHDRVVHSAARATVRGRDLVLSAAVYSLCSWDLHEGKALGEPLLAFRDFAFRVDEVRVLPGPQPLAVVAGTRLEDRAGHLWGFDLSSGDPLWTATATGTGSTFLDCAQVDGRGHVLVGGPGAPLSLWEIAE